MTDALVGGIDLGGTKIESVLFDRVFAPLAKRRRATPTNHYTDVLAALEGEVRWLRHMAQRADLPVGVAMPGLVDAASEAAFAANVAVTGEALGPDLRARLGGQVVCGNDGQCFTLSEAHGGAGASFDRVFGLILGTGLGGGLCQGGQIVSGLNGMAGEIGHLGVSADLVARFNLPLIECGCGRRGCVETLVSGPGLARLAETVIGEPRSAVAMAARPDDLAHRHVFHIWAEVLGDVLHGVQLHNDPDCVVLGGGLSNIAGVERWLSAALARAALPGVRLPEILMPLFGDSSGSRGAALLAVQRLA